jgi:hypothetical protein
MDVYLPFGDRLAADNRWVQLVAMIPWETFETSYAEQFSVGQGGTSQVFPHRLEGVTD